VWLFWSIVLLAMVIALAVAFAEWTGIASVKGS
jgi:hypothetical protein